MSTTAQEAGAPPGTAPAAGHDPVDTAWRLIADIQDRIRDMDAKCGICLTVELGVLTAAAALAGAGTVRVAAPWSALFVLGAALLAAAVAVAINVITPRTHGGQDQDVSGDLLYFGNIRAMHPADLAAALRGVDLLDVLTRQSVHTSAIAWTKARRLRLSLRLATAGLALVALAAIAGSLDGGAR